MHKLNGLIDFMHRPFRFSVTRIISLVGALLISALLLIHPTQIAANATDINHGYLILLMLGLSGGFVHGIGFNPNFWLWKIVFSPYFSWVILSSFVFFSVE